MQILVVEDNPAEARLTREAFAEAGIAHNMSVVEDGEQAIAFLRHDAPFQRSEAPDIILLDLNLPKMDGRVVLRIIKSDPVFSTIPVIVVTNSQSQEDIDQVYLLQANCYLVKPPGVEEFFTMVRKIVEFWWQTARLPNGPLPRPPKDRQQ